MSRAGVRRLIDAGHITVNGERAKASLRLKARDNVVIRMPEVRDVGLIGEALPLSILYEDEDVLVVNKAAGMVVHPAAGCASGTLVNAVLHHCPAIAGIGGERRPGIVHRLDKDTSGVMVVAKNDLSMRSLMDQFKSRTVHKEYLALVYGYHGGRPGRDRSRYRSPSDRSKADVQPARNRQEPPSEDTMGGRGALFDRDDCAGSRLVLSDSHDTADGAHASNPSSPSRYRSPFGRRSCLRSPAFGRDRRR